MVTVREHVPLSEYTTLRLGGPARRFAEAATEAGLVAGVRAVDERREPLLVLGGGSNLVVADEGFPGTVIRVATAGVHALAAAGSHPPGGAGPRAESDVPGAADAPGTGEPKAGEAPGAGEAGAAGDSVTVTVAAGEDWDSFVAWSVREGLAGVECLSGIPGLAGATPIQNVGAYGQEVSDTITSVRVYDRTSGSVLEMPGSGCGFGYRTSAFKRAAAAAGGVTGRFVVLGVTFRLRRRALSEPVRYGELARSLGVEVGDGAPLAAVRAAVLALRRAKGMVLDPADPDTASAGSFFTNPVLSQAQFGDLRRLVAAAHGHGTRIPAFPAGGGAVKVPAAWLIEHAGFGKGYPAAGGTGPRISGKHTLALVNPGGATTAALVALAMEIRDGVRKVFGVELVPEPVLTGGWR